MSGTGAAERLRARILSVIGRGAAAALPDPEFESLALAVFQHQFERNRAYRVYCESRDLRPGRVRRWQQIPAVPTDAFKAAPLLCGVPEDAEAVFRTSGTTAGPARRGTHYLLDTSLYRAALAAGFSAHLLPEGRALRTLALVPSPHQVPDSSLSFMIGEVVARFGAAGSGFLVSGGGLDLEGIRVAFHQAAIGSEPLLLVGTSAAFLHLLEGLEAENIALRLPPGSRAMDTGGFKVRSAASDRGELLERLGERVGIPPAWVVNEYGMTEMSSQFYDGIAGRSPGEGVERRHRGPGWVRTLAVDPETLRPLPPGEVGVLRHLDLANVDSVSALQTADLGQVGEDGIVLLGRASGAETRGCSLAMDELLEALAREPRRAGAADVPLTPPADRPSSAPDR